MIGMVSGGPQCPTRPSLYADGSLSVYINKNASALDVFSFSLTILLIKGKEIE